MVWLITTRGRIRFDKNRIGLNVISQELVFESGSLSKLGPDIKNWFPDDNQASPDVNRLRQNRYEFIRWKF